MVALINERTASDDLKRLGLRIQVSQEDEMNMMRSWLKVRGETIPASNSQKTHCPEGHRLSLDNLVKSAYPRRRQCRICWNKMMRDKYHAKKEVQANG